MLYLWFMPILLNQHDFVSTKTPCPIITKESCPNKTLSFNSLPVATKDILKSVSNSCGKSSFTTNGNNSPIVCGNNGLIIFVFIYPPGEGKIPPNTPIPVAMIVSREYQWKKGSTTEIEHTNEGLKIVEKMLN